MSKAWPILLAGVVVLACCVTHGVAASRCDEMASKVAALEKRISALQNEVATRPEQAVQVEMPPPRRPETRSVPAPGTVATPEALRPSDAPTVDPGFNPSQEEALARNVDQILKERYGLVPLVEKIQETPMDVVARELELSPDQKAQIAELVKRFGKEAQDTLMENGLADLKGLVEKMKVLGSRFDYQVKSLMDPAQQEKFDALKLQEKLFSDFKLNMTDED